jgi:hypothetical protein
VLAVISKISKLLSSLTFLSTILLLNLVRKMQMIMTCKKHKKKKSYLSNNLVNSLANACLDASIVSNNPIAICFGC